MHNRIEQTICPVTMIMEQPEIFLAVFNSHIELSPHSALAKHTLTHVYCATCGSADNLFSLSRIELRIEKCASHCSLFCSVKMHVLYNKIASKVN